MGVILLFVLVKNRRLLTSWRYQTATMTLHRELFYSMGLWNATVCFVAPQLEGAGLFFIQTLKYYVLSEAQTCTGMLTCEVLNGVWTDRFLNPSRKFVSASWTDRLFFCRNKKNKRWSLIPEMNSIFGKNINSKMCWKIKISTNQFWLIKHFFNRTQVITSYL